MNNYSLGNFICELRERLGLSQAQLGALVGVSNKAVSKWENGAALPKLSVLHRLAEVLGLTLDELLACKYPDKPDARKGSFAMKKELWAQTDMCLTKLYGDCPPPEVLARYQTEKLYLEQGDMIVHLHGLAKICQMAKDNRSVAFVSGDLGACLIAWLLNITQVNPLSPHYRCPNCKRMIFHPEIPDGWDLPAAICTCGTPMLKDGHRIPCEGALTHLADGLRFEVRLPAALHDTAADILRAFYAGSMQLCPVDFLYDDIHCYALLPEDSVSAPKQLSYEEYHSKAQHHSGILLRSSPKLEQLHRILQLTNRKAEHIDFLGHTASNFSELLQQYGKQHMTTAVNSPSQPLVFREDLYLLLAEKLENLAITGTGLALQVMNSVYKGRYTQDGIPPQIRSVLQALSFPEEMTEAIENILYLFPKGHAVEQLRIELLLDWFSVHEPDSFHLVTQTTKKA